MPVDPVKIPQNVYREDQILGPVSLRQIIISMVSGGISYVLWTAMKKAGNTSLLGLLIAWSPFVLGIAFAFVKIHGISLTRFVLLFVEKFEKPPVRLWGPRKGVRINLTSVPKTTKKQNDQKTEASPTPDIQELSKTLDAGPPLPPSNA